MGIHAECSSLYTDAETLSEANPAYSSLSQPACVVMHLILNREHHVYTDRYYTSVPLTQALLDAGTHFTGICVKSRVGFPDIVRSSTFWLQGDEVHVYRAEAHLCVGVAGSNHKESSVDAVHQLTPPDGDYLITTHHPAQTCGGG